MHRWVQSGALPWLGIQAAIVVVAFLIAKVIAKRLEPAFEERARTIRDNPGLLRIVVALLRRLHWAVFAILLFVSLLIARQASQQAPSLIALALPLALTWFVASVVTRVIRNRLAARIVQWTVWIVAALYILGLTDDASELLNSAAVPIGTSRFSLLILFKLVALLAVTIWLATTIGNFLDRRIQTTEDLTPSMRVLFGKIAKIGLIILAGAFALSTAGIDLTAFTVLSGAVGVGIGFGLQKVVSNFISGVIILLDKSIKPGDTITVGETFGWIRELRARFVSVVTRDGREYLIPNEDFITKQVVNWSFTDDLVRLDIKFGVSYGSDPHKVSELAIAAASGVARVEARRRPVCWITNFGDSSIDFVLRFWIHDPQQGLTNVRGKVFLALWDTFKANGVEIPYPVRTVIMNPPKAGSREAEISD